MARAQLATQARGCRAESGLSGCRAVLMVQAQLATQARGCRAEVGWGYRAARVRSPRSASVAHMRYYQLIRARCRQGQQIQRWSRQQCRRQRMRRRR